MALAVSGGSDSMALLRLADESLVPHEGPHPSRAEGGARHLPPHRFAMPEKDAGPRLSVLTVDHGLRAQSAAEAKQVAEWTAALGLLHVTLTWDGPKPRTGLQAKARQARYELMAGWCRAHGASVLLTAHTLDDQAETVLMRLARTSSFDSLAGIYRIGGWNGLKLFRPLLGERREALRSWLLQVGQGWIDDPSNADERFERVRIRKAMPLLGELGIAPEALARLAAQALDVTHALWGAAQDWVRLHVEDHDTGYCHVDREAFADQTELLKTRILGLLISRYGAGAMPEPGQLDLLSAWLASPGLGRRTLGGAVVARRSRTLLIGREAGRIDAAPAAVPASGELLWDGRFQVKAPPGSVVRPAVAAGKFSRCGELPAFVQASLPAVTGVEGGTILPSLKPGDAVSARFCR